MTTAICRRRGERSAQLSIVPSVTVLIQPSKFLPEPNWPVSIALSQTPAENYGYGPSALRGMAVYCPAFVGSH